MPGDEATLRKHPLVSLTLLWHPGWAGAENEQRREDIKLRLPHLLPGGPQWG